MENNNNGNIKLNKSAPRDKNGKRRGGFSQHDHLENDIARTMDFETLGIYAFLLNNAGGNFRCTAKNLIAVSPGSKLNDSKASRILNKLINAGWLERIKVGQNGKCPVYEYRVCEVSTKLQAAKQPAPTTRTQAGTLSPAPAIDTSDFSVDEIEVAAASDNYQDAEKAPAPIPSPPITETVKQHIENLCIKNGLYAPWLTDKVQACCIMWQKEHNEYANDSLIIRFIDQLSQGEGQNAATVYRQCVPQS